MVSGGEKQKLATARLLYHKPKYAIVDECSSAVVMLGRARCSGKDLGITLLTVTHHPSLQQLRQHVMKFDGNGSYKMGRVRGPAFAVGLACHRASRSCVLQSALLLLSLGWFAATEG